ncbi:hypothetical protein ACJMK2_020076 [Sinanodonta woodiana]|uniref:Uncharacterized protein n=1 Tax=Sinanodonta woodiana TaxID=1069815 RepID=A0ABD3U0Q9_SINWO
MKTSTNQGPTTTERTVTTYTTVPLPPCKVCSGTSTGFHFGVITCEACKAFFRRALLQKQNYKCAKDDNCTITDTRLGNCSSCRLKKCFALGMSKGGVRRGRYSIALRTKAIIEARSLEGREIIVSQSSSSYAYENHIAVQQKAKKEAMDTSDSDSNSLLESEESRSPTGYMPEQEVELKNLIDTLVSCQDIMYPHIRKYFENKESIQKHHEQIHEAYKMKKEMFGTENNISTEEFQQIFAETGLDPDDRLVMFDQKGRSMEHYIQQVINFAKVIPGFRSINSKDVAKLLKASHYEFWMFGYFQAVDSKLQVCGGDDLVDSHISDMSKFFSEDFIKEGMKFSDSLKLLQLTIEETALIRAICLTFTDRCTLDEPEKIENLQLKYISCLVYYLQTHSDQPGKRLAAIFDRLYAVRSLSHRNIEVNQEFLHSWGFLIHEYPLWNEMLAYSGNE